MDHEPFLAHLRENPADLTAWLVYADWLDEQNDPTGAFVRLSLDLTAGLGPTELDAIRELIARFERLYAAANPAARDLLAAYRAGVPFRFRVTESFLIGHDPPRDMFGYARTVVCGIVERGSVETGSRICSEDGTWSPWRPVQGVEVFVRMLERAEAGREPFVVGLGLLGHHPLPPGTVLVASPREPRPEAR